MRPLYFKEVPLIVNLKQKLKFVQITLNRISQF
jgi:hypothetical protein